MTQNLATVEAITRELLARRSAVDSLLAFTEITHPSWKPSDHHTKLCFYLEKLEALAPCPHCGRAIDALAVFAPRRHGKTELVSRRFPAWFLGRHPEANVICAQATGLLAFDTGADVRNIVTSPEFRRIFDSVELREDAQAAGRWITNKNGIYFAVGVGGTSVGRGANVLDIDDPHGGREDADSQRMRDIAGNWYFGDVLPTLMPPARQLLTLTRWNQDDLASRILPEESTWVSHDDPQFFCADDWHVLRMRAIEGEDTDHAVALWPGHYPLDYLYRLRDKMYKGNRGREWKAQYQQQPVAEEGTFLMRDWFKQRYSELPPACNHYITTDFAVTKQTGRKDPDRTEIGVVALGPDDRAYGVDWLSIVGTTDVWIERLLDMIEKYHPVAVFGEKGLIKNAIEPPLQRRMAERSIYARFEWMPTAADKITRGHAFQVWAASGRVVLPSWGPWVENMVDELAAIGGGGRYDDKFDAWSHFFLAIDHHHPAIVRGAPPAREKHDPWTVIDGGRRDNWKTA